MEAKATTVKAASLAIQFFEALQGDFEILGKAKPTTVAAHRLGGVRTAAPGWKRYCGWCGFTRPVVTDGRNLMCSHCGH